MRRFVIIFLITITALSSYGQLTVGTLNYFPGAYKGYTLITPYMNKDNYLIDMCGNVVNQWHGQMKNSSAAYLTTTGKLLRSVRLPNIFGSGSGGRIEKLGWYSQIEWVFTHNTDSFCLHHDFIEMPNGHILAIAWELISEEEALELGRDSMYLSIDGIWSEKIIEIAQTGQYSSQIVWEWHLKDHFIQDFDSSKVNFGIIANHPELVDINFNEGNDPDIFHMNSIDYDPVFDKILLSVRDYNEIWIIDHSTSTFDAASHLGGAYNKGGDLLFRWGNPAAYQRGDESNREFYMQHHARWQANANPGEEVIRVFNNGNGRPGGDMSSIDQIVVALDSTGNYPIDNEHAYLPMSLNWQWTDPSNEFFSAYMGSVQSLPNENMLVCEGWNGRIFEINPVSGMVWEYMSPVGNTGPVAQGEVPLYNILFSAMRYDPNYPGIAGYQFTTHPPIQLNEPVIPCFDTTVIVGIEENNFDDLLKITGNPVHDALTISNPQSLEVIIEISNTEGRLMLNGKFNTSPIRIPLSGWPQGLYFIRAYNQGFGVLLSEKFVRN